MNLRLAIWLCVLAFVIGCTDGPQTLAPTLIETPPPTHAQQPTPTSAPSPTPELPPTPRAASRPGPVAVEYATAKSLQEIVELSTIIAIGAVSDDEPVTRQIHWRDRRDPTKLDPDHASVGKIYQVDVERYFSGGGDDRLPILQFESMLARDPNGALREIRRRDADFPMRPGTRYLLFLAPHDQAPELMFGVIQPSRWILSSGSATVESPAGGFGGRFPTTPETELIAQVEAILRGESGSATSTPSSLATSTLESTPASTAATAQSATSTPLLSPTATPPQMPASPLGTTTITPSPTPAPMPTVERYFNDDPPKGSGVEIGSEYPFTLATHCGIRDARFDGRHWMADPLLDDGYGNPPKDWRYGDSVGVMALVGQDHARFTSETGRVINFKPWPSDVYWIPCA